MSTLIYKRGIWEIWRDTHGCYILKKFTEPKYSVNYKKDLEAARAYVDKRMDIAAHK